jgi:hypothetical protein
MFFYFDLSPSRLGYLPEANLIRTVFHGVTKDPQSIARVRHALPFYILWVASLETALQLFQG